MLSSLFSTLAQAEAGTGSDWNWLLIFIVFVVIVVVAMVIQTRFSAQEADELAHASHHVEEAHLEAEAVPEPGAEAEVKVVAASAVTTQPDDLKKIEGIGPKVAGLLNENGITTFARLAETPVDTLNAILEAARLQMMQPDSWPRQARLAAAGDWETLQKLQDELKGGR